MWKACGCKCGKGHLKKDLDWIAPAATSPNEDKKKKNRKKKINDKPTVNISGPNANSNGKYHLRSYFIFLTTGIICNYVE